MVWLLVVVGALSPFPVPGIWDEEGSRVPSAVITGPGRGGRAHRKVFRLSGLPLILEPELGSQPLDSDGGPQLLFHALQAPRSAAPFKQLPRV